MALGLVADIAKPLVEKVRQRNNFDFLRLFAATAVIITHCYPLTGRPEGHDPLAQLSPHLSFSFIGLRTFFFISGFLIAQSLVRSKSVSEYLFKRTLRIIPGLFAAICISIFILGPLVTRLPVQEYFLRAETWTYFKNLALYTMQYDLPGVFVSNPYRQPVNGSLWTLMYEFTFYIMLLAFSLLGGLKNKWIPLLAFAAALALRVYFVFNPKYFEAWYPMGLTNLSVKYTLDFGLYFLAGMVLLFHKDSLPLNLWTLVSTLAIYGIALHVPFGGLSSYICLPIIILSFAFAPQLAWLNGAGRYGDFSYGMYIYAFPVQQAIVHFSGSQISLVMMGVLSVGCTLPFAIASWHLVEKPFLKLKQKL